MEKQETVIKLTYTADELEDEIQDLLMDKELQSYHRIIRKHNHLLTLLAAKKQLMEKRDGTN